MNEYAAWWQFFLAWGLLMLVVGIVGSLVDWCRRRRPGSSSHDD